MLSRGPAVVGAGRGRVSPRFHELHEYRFTSGRITRIEGITGTCLAGRERVHLAGRISGGRTDPCRGVCLLPVPALTLSRNGAPMLSG